MYQSNYHKFVVIPILPILAIVLSSYANATPETNSINIISPSNNSQVQTGNLTITGTAVYDSSQPCSVYATWNNSQSLRHLVSIINDGKNYSMWKFTFAPKSHEIIEGPNTLTAILTCVNLPSNNQTLNSSIIVDGIKKLDKENDLSDMGSELSEMIPTTTQNNTQKK